MPWFFCSLCFYVCVSCNYRCMWMGVVSRKILPACGSLCFLCPSLRTRSRQPVKRYKKMLSEIFPKSLVSSSFFYLLNIFFIYYGNFISLLVLLWHYFIFSFSSESQWYMKHFVPTLFWQGTMAVQLWTAIAVPHFTCTNAILILQSYR